MRRIKKRTRKFAKGKKALAICDRGGHQVPYSKTVIEPGTGLRVDKRWNDGRWNRVDHPQNFPADTGESVGLKDPRPARTEPSVLLLDESGEVITDDNGLPFFAETEKNILGESYEG